MIENVHRKIKWCVICEKAKSRETAQGLYIQLPVLDQSRVNESMDFILRLPRTEKGKDTILVVAD